LYTTNPTRIALHSYLGFLDKLAAIFLDYDMAWLHVTV